jgi:hypothetical protein
MMQSKRDVATETGNCMKLHHHRSLVREKAPPLDRFEAQFAVSCSMVWMRIGGMMQPCSTGHSWNIERSYGARERATRRLIERSYGAREAPHTASMNDVMDEIRSLPSSSSRGDEVVSGRVVT